jgi:hypothetical protein
MDRATPRRLTIPFRRSSNTTEGGPETIRSPFGLRDTRLTRVGRLRRHAITVDLLAVWVGSMVARRARRLRDLGA